MYVEILILLSYINRFESSAKSLILVSSIVDMVIWNEETKLRHCPLFITSQNVTTLRFGLNPYCAARSICLGLFALSLLRMLLACGGAHRQVVW